MSMKTSSSVRWTSLKADRPNGMSSSSLLSVSGLKGKSSMSSHPISSTPTTTTSSSAQQDFKRPHNSARRPETADGPKPSSVGRTLPAVGSNRPTSASVSSANRNAAFNNVSGPSSPSLSPYPAPNSPTIDRPGNPPSSSRRLSSLESLERLEPVSPAPSVDSSHVVIHVCDEARQINQDFQCRKDLLLSEMAYFRAYLSEAESSENIDISVHCDIQIFEFLVNYLHQKHLAPRLEVATVTPILISAHFLQMKDLVRHCLRFFKTHADQILKMPIDLNCLNAELVSQLADLFSVDELEALSDRKDKLQSRLYMKHVQNLLTEEHRTIHRCGYCLQLFTDSQRQWMMCPKGQLFIDFHGTVVSEHVSSSRFNINKLLLAYRNIKMSWREIYWAIWGFTTTLKCLACDQRFVACDLGHCSYHTQNAVFSDQSNTTGVYPCCKQPATRFDAAQGDRTGCHARHHVVGGDKEEMAMLETILRHQSFIMRPFRPPPAPSSPLHASPSTTRAATSPSQHSGVHSERASRGSASSSLEAAFASGGAIRARRGSVGDSGRNYPLFATVELGDESDDGSEDEDDSHGSLTSSDSEFHQRFWKGGRRAEKRQTHLSPGRLRTYKMDVQRIDDTTKIREMMAQLDASRAPDPVGVVPPSAARGSKPPVSAKRAPQTKLRMAASRMSSGAPVTGRGRSRGAFR